MKTVGEIKTKIGTLRKLKHRYSNNREVSEKAIERFQENIDSQIRALRWVLGEKMVAYYFCVLCLFAHKSKTCPRCGRHTVG